MTFKTEIKKVKQEVISECACDKCGNDIMFIDYYGSYSHRATNLKDGGGVLSYNTQEDFIQNTI